MSRLESLRAGVDPVLTEISQGYSNPAFVGTKILPIVKVAKKSGKYIKFGRDNFFVPDDSIIRGIRAGTQTRYPVEISTGTFNCLRYSIKDGADDAELEEAQEVFDLEQDIVRGIQETIRLKLEYQIATVLQDTSTYTHSNHRTLTATEKWDDPSGADYDPIGDIQEAKSAVRNLIGRYPNSCILGISAYESLVKSPQILDRIKYSQAGVVTTEILEAVLDIPNIYVGMGVYTSGTGESFSDIWKDNVVLAYVPENPRSVRVPAFGYTFEVAGYPVTTRWYDEDTTTNWFRNEDYYDFKVTFDGAGFLIKDVNS